MLISYYDLVEETDSQIECKMDANSTQFGISIPKNKNKTLYELKIYKDLYPEHSKLYSFILYEDKTTTPSTSSNPLEINFINNTITYENYKISNIGSPLEYNILDPLPLPKFENESIIVEGVELSIEYNNSSYTIETYISEGKIVLAKQLYFDLIEEKIVDDISCFKVNGLSLPISQFKITFTYYGVGTTFSTIQIEQKYINNKELLGNCEEAIFCFQ